MPTIVLKYFNYLQTDPVRIPVDKDYFSSVDNTNSVKSAIES